MYFGQIKKALLTNESIFAGTPVLTITAKDRDSGDFGTEGIVYQVTMSDDDSFTLAIVVTLALVVTINAFQTDDRWRVG